VTTHGKDETDDQRYRRQVDHRADQSNRGQRDHAKVCPGWIPLARYARHAVARQARVTDWPLATRSAPASMKAFQDVDTKKLVHALPSATRSSSEAPRATPKALASTRTASGTHASRNAGRASASSGRAEQITMAARGKQENIYSPWVVARIRDASERSLLSRSDKTGSVARNTI